MPRLPGSASTRLAGLDAERRVVVLGVVVGRADVDRLVAQTGQVRDQVGLELEAGVVGTEVDAHGTRSCPIRAVAGVDGVPGGWVVVAGRPAIGSSGRCSRTPPRCWRRPADCAAVGVDIPLGLPAGGSRPGLRRAGRAGAGPGPLVGVPGPAARGAGRRQLPAGVCGGAPADRPRDQPADVPHRTEDPGVGRAAALARRTSSRCIPSCASGGSRPQSRFASKKTARGAGPADRRAGPVAVIRRSRWPIFRPGPASTTRSTRWPRPGRRSAGPRGEAEMLGAEQDDRGRPAGIVV